MLWKMIGIVFSYSEHLNLIPLIISTVTITFLVLSLLIFCNVNSLQNGFA